MRPLFAAAFALPARSARAIALAWLLAGCAGWDTGNAARRDAAAALECAEASVTVTPVGQYRYRGEGCGRSVVVACTAGQLEPRCLREGRALASAGGEAREPEDDVPPGASEREPVASEPVASEAAEREPPGSEPPERDPSLERVVRDRLDARAADIVACAGRDRVAVRVSWAVDGSLDVRLQGSLAGSPEEGCVQDLLEGARAPSEGRAGVVVHLVRAPPPGG